VDGYFRSSSRHLFGCWLVGFISIYLLVVHWIYFFDNRHHWEILAGLGQDSSLLAYRQARIQYLIIKNVVLCSEDRAVDWLLLSYFAVVQGFDSRILALDLCWAVTFSSHAITTLSFSVLDLLLLLLEHQLIQGWVGGRWRHLHLISLIKCDLHRRPEPLYQVA